MPIAQNGAVSLHYDTYGRGEPLILSSGLGGSGGFWQPQLDALSQRYRVITYDHAGAGRSSRDVGPRSVAEMASDLLAVLDAAGADRAHVVGHAIGGTIGLQAGLQDPGRLRSLVIVNGWVGPDAHIDRCFAIRREILRASGRAAYLRAQPLFLYPATWISRHAAEMEAHADAALTTMPSDTDLLARIDAFTAYDPGSALATMAVRTLCVASRDDMLVPWHMSKTLARRLPDARLALTEWGGHAFTQAVPEVFHDLLREFYHDLTGDVVA
ncbi:pyrimidine utilization protein D [Pseudooceanicola sediminis]|uniref:Putative carbamate hydrolase RutD n=1 Tax=Pseudooceanicola sediminis TaxID=2211117 RepID=A0A399IY34_9RHOB|nr:pyrimidine utilization protein D [Pseudooceanicola sediminis]KAA2312084.1 pyrimidine utilization protein D [Puniceibacterium sp. HSS470]RII38093.1 pyrimidine utilization protein D [Pseudooceanicola sediminis]|tara:strand:+ start:37877 stop:38686 length:810 start_codon:yes stop_codon:yes gene_type:complete